MNSNIRSLTCEDLPDFWEIVALSGSEGYYPEYKEGRIGWFKKIMTECDNFKYYGAFRNDRLMGGMAIGDFKLNLRSSLINLSGVGMVHTDMLHKKEKICKDLMTYFIDSNRKKKVNMLFLSPFRPDFYKRMGFGYGTSLYHYHLAPQHFPDSGSKENLFYASDEDKQEFLNCFQRSYEQTHGAVDRNPFWLIETFGSGKRIVVYKSENKIHGALVFSFGAEKEMMIEEWFYENSEVLYSFCSFLHSQSDQFDYISLSTPDEYFYYVLSNPCDSLKNLEISSTRIDNMFRVIDVVGLFQELGSTNFNNQNAVLDIAITDTFYPQNNKTTTIEFVNGYAKVVNGTSSKNRIEIRLDISDFSSLILGSIHAKSLYRLGLLKISDKRMLELVESLFLIGPKPLCTVHI